MNVENYHSIVGKIRTLLEENSCEFEHFEHEAVRTSEEASKMRTGYAISQGVKALIARVKEPNVGKKFVMFVVSGDKKFAADKIKQHFGFTDIRFATETEVGEITGGVLPGGVPPFGNLFGLEVYADASLLANEKIIFNAGDRRYSIGMRADEYRKLVEPRVEDIVA